MNLPIINHDDYVAKINDDNKFPIKKFGELAKYLVSEGCLLYTSPSPRDGLLSRMPSSA